MSVFAGRAAGSFGELGGVIEFEWVPDPSVIAGRIMHLAGYLENFIPPLEASKAIAKADMQMHFDTESSPDGAAWAPLSEEYVATRRGGSAHPILQLSGSMHDAAVSDAAYLVDGEDLFFSTAGLPFYWIFHESGRGSSVPGMAEFAARIKEQFGEQTDISEHTGGGMPARPFVGVSFEAQLQIIEAFDAWFEGGISGFYASPGGTVQTRGPGGRFGPAIRGG